MISIAIGSVLSEPLRYRLLSVIKLYFLLTSILQGLKQAVSSHFLNIYLEWHVKGYIQAGFKRHLRGMSAENRAE